MATNDVVLANKTSTGDDSSESDGETEPAKSFHRCFSTNKNIKSSVINFSFLRACLHIPELCSVLHPVLTLFIETWVEGALSCLCLSLKEIFERQATILLAS